MSLNTTVPANITENNYLVPSFPSDAGLNTSVPAVVGDNYAVPSLPIESISGKEDKSNKGIANGYASLDATSKVPSGNLPTIDVSGQIASHNSVTTSVHGIANTAELATKAYADGAGLKAGVQWTDRHTTSTGNPYTVGSIVYNAGRVYGCIAENDSIPPQQGGNPYWADLGVGYLLPNENPKIKGGSIDTRVGAVTQRTYETGDPENPTEIETSLAGGSGGNILMRGGDGGFDSDSGGTGGNSGSINLSGTATGGDGNGGHGGSITLVGGYGSASAGSINLNAGAGGADNHGGSIISTGNNEHRGGTLNMSAGEGEGGSINTSNHGGSINTSDGGGSINTSDGGGSINTRGTGSIQLGVDGTRTTLNGSASVSNKTIALPDASGTIALISDAKNTAVDYLYNYAGIDSGYVITNIKFRQTLSNAIWQAQTSPVTAEFNRDATSSKNNALALFTKVFAGGYSMVWLGSELGVGFIGETYEPMLVISHQKLLATIADSNQQSNRTIFNTYDVWTATDYNNYLPVSGYQYCEVTWIATNIKSNFTAGKLALGNTDRTTTIQTTSTAPRTITLPNATGTVALTSDVTSLQSTLIAFAIALG